MDHGGGSPGSPGFRLRQQWVGEELLHWPQRAFAALPRCEARPGPFFSFDERCWREGGLGAKTKWPTAIDEGGILLPSGGDEGGIAETGVDRGLLCCVHAMDRGWIERKHGCFIRELLDTALW